MRSRVVDAKASGIRKREVTSVYQPEHVVQPESLSSRYLQRYLLENYCGLVPPKTDLNMGFKENKVFTLGPPKER